MHQMKTIFDGREHQNIKVWVNYLYVGSYTKIHYHGDKYNVNDLCNKEVHEL